MKQAMTIFFAALLLCAAAIPAQAQSPVQKGKWMVDGMVGFQSQSGDLYENAEGDGVSTIFIQPEAAYFFMDQLAIGGILRYTSTTANDNTSSTTEIGPQIGYFFKTGNPQFLPFLGGGLLFGSAENYTSTTIFLAGGVMFVINSSVGVSGQLQYDIESLSPDGDGDSVSGNVLKLFFGFNIFIP